MAKLLTEYNNYLASLGQPIVTTNGQTLEWLFWAKGAVCGQGDGSPDLIKVNGTCQNYSALQNINAGNDPEVEFTCSGEGIYTMFLRATNTAQGCSKLSQICYDAQSCTVVCTSNVSISISGCNLLAASSNCGGASYQWRDPNNLIVGTSASITATQNGIYTVIVTGCNNCGTLQNSINVNCGTAVTCNCTPVYTLSNCILTADVCSGWAVTHQRSLNSNSGYVNVTSGQSYVPTTNNRWYRAQYTKAGCTTKYSNPIYVNCVTAPCNIDISISIDGNCNIVGSWTGASTTATVQWRKKVNDNGSCTGATGTFTVYGATTNATANSGTSTLVPNNGDGCYEMLVDDGTCVEVAQIYWVDCCPLPCDGNYRTRSFFLNFKSSVSVESVENRSIDSLVINGVEQISTPQLFSYISNITHLGNAYNSTLISEINALGIMHFTAGLPETIDKITALSEFSRYFRIKAPECWTWTLRLKYDPAQGDPDHIRYIDIHSNGSVRQTWTGALINDLEMAAFENANDVTYVRALTQFTLDYFANNNITYYTNSQGTNFITNEC